MSKTQRILYTFDVEVFFNQCGSSLQLIKNNCDMILNTLNEFNVKGVFYIDATHYWYAEKQSEASVISYYRKLIEKLRLGGHEIGLHTHPHWLDAIGFDGNYDFSDLKNYSSGFAALSYFSTLQQVISVFQNMIKEIDQNYKVITYRAGGYCSQPYQNILELLKDTDIFIDSSVVPGLKSNVVPFSFDYTKSSTGEPYFFGKENTMRDPNGNNIELPVFTFELSSTRRIYEKIKRISSEGYKPFGAGSGLNFNKSFADRFRPVRKVITTDDSDVYDIRWALKQEKAHLVTLVNHPKLLSDAGLKNLRETIECFQSTSLTMELKSLNVRDFP